MNRPDTEAPDSVPADRAQGEEQNRLRDSAPRRTAMTSAERLELGKLLRLRGKVAKEDLKARGAEQVALVERQLCARYSAGAAAWCDIAATADAAVKAADAAIAERCRALGIPAAFRPGLSMSWYSRGENAEAGRRSELRLLARAEIDARVKRALVEVDRSVSSLTTQLLAGAVVSDKGQEFLAALPSIDQLLPAPTLADIERIAANTAKPHDPYAYINGPANADELDAG